MSYGICPTVKVANGSEEQRSVQWICCLPNKKKKKKKDFQSFNSKPARAVSVCLSFSPEKTKRKSPRFSVGYSGLND